MMAAPDVLSPRAPEIGAAINPRNRAAHLTSTIEPPPHDVPTLKPADRMIHPHESSWMTLFSSNSGSICPSAPCEGIIIILYKRKIRLLLF